MYIDLSSYPIELELVYEFSKDMTNDPHLIRDTHQLTLDKSRPFMGLRGDKGLFGTQEWWENIHAKVIPSDIKSGVITRTYVAGIENLAQDNSFEYVDDTGKLHDEGIYTLNKNKRSLFRLNHLVVIYYAYDEMKASTIEDPDYLCNVIEMAISKMPVR